jgi:hypothetical protein
MNLEEQVCLKSQGIKLQQLGIFFKSKLAWWNFPLDAVVVAEIDSDSIYDYYPAFSVAELGKMLNVTIQGVLPDEYNTNEVNFWFEINEKYYTTEAQLRAAFLIYIIESGLLSSGLCNKRLIKKL